MLSLIQMPIALVRLLLALARMAWAILRAINNFISNRGGLRRRG